MFGSRKGLAIVLTVVCLLAMLAPAAMAAPEYVHGIVIDSPTMTDPVYILGEPGAAVDVAFTITIYETQVDNVWVRAKLLSKYGEVMVSDWAKFVPGDVVNGAIEGDFNLLLPAWTKEGWYDLRVCAGDEWSDKWCDEEGVGQATGPVLVQMSGPEVELTKPEWKAAVTGKDYLLVGKAKDNFGIAKVTFEYCDISNDPWDCTQWVTEDTDHDVWVKIADGVATNPPITHLAPWVQYQARWDSTQVPDEWPYEFHGDIPMSQWPGGEKSGALIRMCAQNLVGLSNCYSEPNRVAFDETVDGGNWPDAHKVFVNNMWIIDLEEGWNLISSPLLPYNTAIGSVLDHLIANNSVKQVLTRVWNSATQEFEWQVWVPTLVGPQSLTTIEDGKAYWIDMVAEDELMIRGTWKTVGMTSPPSYWVRNDEFGGWNLIGYTQFGRPMYEPSKIAEDYLGPEVWPNVKSFYRYDAAAEIYKLVAVHKWDPMMKGAGYWLSVSQDGNFTP